MMLHCNSLNLGVCRPLTCELGPDFLMLFCRNTPIAVGIAIDCRWQAKALDGRDNQKDKKKEKDVH